jgi:hypothetical protein
MKIKSLALTTSIAISGTIATGAIMPVSALTFDVLSFGEDKDANGGANFTLSTSASYAAEQSFIAKLNSLPTTQTFDSVVLTPPADAIARLLSTGTPLTTANFPGTSSIVTTSTEVAQTATTNFSTKGIRFNDTATTPTTNGRFAISGNNYYEVGNGTFTITFSNAMAALGFYATDVEDPTGMILTFDNDPNKTLTIPRSAGAGNTDKSALYYGFVATNPSEIFTSVTFGRSISDSNDKFGLDNLSFATPSQVRNLAATSVPEPLTIIGTLIGSGAAIRFRKKLKSNPRQ